MELEHIYSSAGSKRQSLHCNSLHPISSWRSLSEVASKLKGPWIYCHKIVKARDKPVCVSPAESSEIGGAIETSTTAGFSKMMPKPQSTRDEDMEAGREAHHETSASDEHEDFLGSTVKSLFGQCAGFVDVAAFVIQSCRGESDNGPNRQSGILGPLFEIKKVSKKTRRSQGGTLEFPAEGTFKDDVSDLSANTLEEMERLAKKMAQQGAWIQPTTDGTKQPLPGQQLLPPPRQSHKNGVRPTWTSEREKDDAEAPLGVAASDSSSTLDEIPHQNRDWQRKDGVQLFRAQVES